VLESLRSERRQTLARVDGLLQEVAQSDASRVHLRFVKTAGMGIFGASIESIHMPVCVGGLVITLDGMAICMLKHKS